MVLAAVVGDLQVTMSQNGESTTGYRNEIIRSTRQDFNDVRFPGNLETLGTCLWCVRSHEGTVWHGTEQVVNSEETALCCPSDAVNGSLLGQDETCDELQSLECHTSAPQSISCLHLLSIMTKCTPKVAMEAERSVQLRKSRLECSYHHPRDILKRGMPFLECISCLHLLSMMRSESSE